MSTSTSPQTKHPTPAQHHQVVNHEQWLAARVALLKKEKELTHTRDRISAERRELPWERLEKDYHFHGEHGELSFGDLFEKRPQLIIYHFMFGSDWDEPCKSCSYLSDHFDGMLPHLHARHTTLAAVSHAPMGKILPFKKRMGWKFPWYSSDGSTFNHDFHVSYTDAELAAGKVYYNYEKRDFPAEEAPGMSIFIKDDSEKIFHAYSTYGRGLDILAGTYNFLDHTPRGRDEQSDFPMDWIRFHDRYQAA